MVAGYLGQRAASCKLADNTPVYFLLTSTPARAVRLVSSRAHGSKIKNIDGRLFESR